MLFNGKKRCCKLIGDYGSMILEAKRKTIKGEGLEILPMALAQVKAGNN